MIDSVLKGTGNSRFLKSAVPAGTSWADALAMLQAGTFPIDFNGINAEGFQQVGTPLNKANLLKDATATQIGLPPPPPPDGMFQALGNTGELHVWRKTVFEPAGYRLGTPENGFIVSTSAYNSGNALVSFTTSDTISVDSKGSATQDNPSGDQFFVIAPGHVATIQAKIRGKFVTEKVTAESGYYIDHPGLVYIPDDAILSCITNGTSLGYPYDYCYVVDRMQMVQPYPVNPVVTYPVSTNPNSYQEGDDAKEAGYTLGEVVTGKVLASKCYNNTAIYYGKSVSVSDDGIVSILNPTTRTLSSTLSSAEIAAIKDSFVYFSGNENYSDVSSAFRYGNIVYIPADASVSTEYANSAYGVYIDRYQPVTGYPAIPAGTTIEYLGKLGDKARVQVVSYVGTGRSGADNPNSLTFDFVPKLLFIKSDAKNAHYVCLTLFGTTLTDTYKTYAFFDATGNMTYPDSSYARKNEKKSSGIPLEMHTFRPMDQV